MKYNIYILSALIIGSLSMIAATVVQTPTPEWVNFYGRNSQLNGQLIPIGSIVQAFDSDNVLCGQVSVTTSGEYGLLACYRDDPTTITDEGAEPGDVIRFLIDGYPASTANIITWTAHGDVFEVDLLAQTDSSSEPIAVPEPITIVLFGGGIAGLITLRMRQRINHR